MANQGYGNHGSENGASFGSIGQSYDFDSPYTSNMTQSVDTGFSELSRRVPEGTVDWDESDDIGSIATEDLDLDYLSQFFDETIFINTEDLNEGIQQNEGENEPNDSNFQSFNYDPNTVAPVSAESSLLSLQESAGLTSEVNQTESHEFSHFENANFVEGPINQQQEANDAQAYYYPGFIPYAQEGRTWYYTHNQNQVEVQHQGFYPEASNDWQQQHGTTGYPDLSEKTSQTYDQNNVVPTLPGVTDDASASSTLPKPIRKSKRGRPPTYKDEDARKAAHNKSCKKHEAKKKAKYEELKHTLKSELAKNTQLKQLREKLAREMRELSKGLCQHNLATADQIMKNQGFGFTICPCKGNWRR